MFIVREIFSLFQFKKKRERSVLLKFKNEFGRGSRKVPLIGWQLNQALLRSQDTWLAKGPLPEAPPVAPGRQAAPQLPAAGNHR